MHQCKIGFYQVQLLYAHILKDLMCYILFRNLLQGQSASQKSPRTKSLSYKRLVARYEKLGVSQSSVTCWLKGKNSPDIEVVAQICDIFNISVVELFGTDGSDKYAENEKKVIVQYRKKPELQQAVNILLGIDE